MVSGPDLGVRPGPDLDRTFIFIVLVVVSTVFISIVNILLDDISLQESEFEIIDYFTTVAALSSPHCNYTYAFLSLMFY